MTLIWKPTCIGDCWELYKVVDDDYGPPENPKHLWWSLSGPQDEFIVFPKRFSTGQIILVIDALNEAERLDNVRE